MAGDCRKNFEEDSHGQMKEIIRESFLAAGAAAVGFARAEEVAISAVGEYAAWIDAGHHAGMDYLVRHGLLKRHPSNVLDNASTVISMAFSYAPAQWRDGALPVISCYAYGEDYHEVIRRRLTPVVESLRLRYGGEWRICVDTAPLAERYWAVMSGIGKRGRNGSVIVENCGSYNFLAEVLTTLCVAPDAPSRAFCADCGECMRACPQKAISGDGTVDARRCINYLTIESRGDWGREEMSAMHTASARECLYGCDICQRVCPHNRDVTPTAIEEFKPRKGIMELTAADVLEMTQNEFSSFFKGSAMKRAKLAGLRRNARNILEGGDEDQAEGQSDLP